MGVKWDLKFHQADASYVPTSIFLLPREACFTAQRVMECHPSGMRTSSFMSLVNLAALILEPWNTARKINFAISCLNACSGPPFFIGS